MKFGKQNHKDKTEEKPLPYSIQLVGYTVKTSTVTEKGGEPEISLKVSSLMAGERKRVDIRMPATDSMGKVMETLAHHMSGQHPDGGYQSMDELVGTIRQGLYEQGIDTHLSQQKFALLR